MADRFYQYEINPVVELVDGIGLTHFEFCSTLKEAEAYQDDGGFVALKWGVYGRKESDNLVEWFADCANPKDAADLVSLIVGREIEPSNDKIVIECPETVQSAYDRGSAVVIFNPDELRGADPTQVMDRLIELGWDVIDCLATEPAPEDEDDDEA